MSKTFTFFHNISWICPACGAKTIYQRRGLDGTRGEGQYCKTCNKFLCEIVPLKFPPSMTTIDSDLIHNNMKYIQTQINDAYSSRIHAEDEKN